MSISDIRIRWYQLLDSCPTKESEWQVLIREYGSLLKYHFTNWTPKGRVQRPTGRRRWKKLILGESA